MIWGIIILSSLVVGVFVWAYFWAIKWLEDSEPENNKSRIQD